MYGLVNRGIQQLVTATKGEAAWIRVCARARVDGEGFIAMQAYPDDLTYALVGAVSEELGLSPSQTLEAFGEYWILYTAEEGYGAVLDSAAGSLRDFLARLNDMHGRIEAVFHHMNLPWFEIEDVGPGEYLLHYESAREGLAPMVLGLVRGLARRFGQAIDIRHEVPRGPAAPRDVFRVRELAG
jgi:hypothetical protein